jgi:hypothetical protein
VGLLASFAAGIGGSLRPLLLRGVYWLIRRTKPRSRLRRILLGGNGYYYGPIAIALTCWLIYSGQIH